MWNKSNSSTILVPGKHRREPAEAEPPGDWPQHGNQRGQERLGKCPRHVPTQDLSASSCLVKWERSLLLLSITQIKFKTKGDGGRWFGLDLTLCCHTALSWAQQFKHWISWYHGNGTTCLYELKKPQYHTVNCGFTTFWRVTYNGLAPDDDPVVDPLSFSGSVLVNPGRSETASWVD